MSLASRPFIRRARIAAVYIATGADVEVEIEDRWEPAHITAINGAEISLRLYADPPDPSEPTAA